SFRSKAHRPGKRSYSNYCAVHFYVHLLSFCSYKTLPRIKELDFSNLAEGQQLEGPRVQQETMCLSENISCPK
mgnify:CR=1